MPFNKIHGQDWPIRGLQQALRDDMVSHAYLFAGPEGVGKFSAAVEFAAALNCDLRSDDSCGKCHHCKALAGGNYPDVVIIGVSEDSRIIKIESVQILREATFLKPLEGRWKVFIIKNADKLGPEAANCLLKTLEEPPPACVLILTAPGQESVLPTIASRCQLIRFNRLPQTFIQEDLAANSGVAPDRAKLLAAMSDGSLGLARKLHEDDFPQLNAWLAEQMTLLGKKDMLEIAVETIEKLSSWGGEKRAGDDLRLLTLSFFDLLSMFFRDAALSASEMPKNKLFNPGLATQLAVLGHRLTPMALVEILDRIHDAKDQIDRNAKWDLVLENLFLDIEVLAATPAS